MGWGGVGDRPETRAQSAGMLSHSCTRPNHVDVGVSLALFGVRASVACQRLPPGWMTYVSPWVLHGGGRRCARLRIWLAGLPCLHWCMSACILSKVDRSCAAGAFVGRTVCGVATSLLPEEPCGLAQGDVRQVTSLAPAVRRAHARSIPERVVCIRVRHSPSHHAGSIQALLLAQRARCCAEHLPCSRCVATSLPQPPTHG